ncbi:MAG TPA: DUF4097 family beta strand repeat-containing protein [Pyrinomonadaceae bacterium]|nr:DUF4097 family beta strand repeat-containing protein [Pyrinomonadaceae bacterium]
MENTVKLIAILVALAAFVLGGPEASAQDKMKDKTKNREFCSQNWSNGDKVSTRDLRETTLSPGSLTVDGKRNGGISVRGEDRSDILVRACVQAWADTEAEAQSLAKGVRIETSGSVRAEGSGDNWSVSYQILVPRNTDLDLLTSNGGISIADVTGTIKFTATNGGVSLANLAGDVKGRTTNGGISVKLSGGSWSGNGLDVQTTNGGVSVQMSESYAARVEAGTTNGGFSSDFPGLKVEKTDEDRWAPTKKQVSADINGGGAPIRVKTTNGGVSIKTAKL